MKHILLTGRRGFVGSHLFPALQQLGQVYAPTSAELNLLDGSATKEYTRRHQIDFIVHAASRGVRITPDATVCEVAQPNLDMFVHLAQLEIPMLQFGSGAEYDKSRDLHKVKESDFGPYIPADPYGWSKYQISKIIEQRTHIFNLRPFGIYGPGENPTRLTTYLIKQILNKLPILLRQNCVFDFIYIDDLVRITSHFVQHPPAEKFINVTPTQSIELLQLARQCVQWFGADIDIQVQTPGMNKEYTGDNSFLLHEMPGFEFTGYQMGMRALYDSLRKGAL